jgi:hypothetical protein
VGVDAFEVDRLGDEVDYLLLERVGPDAGVLGANLVYQVDAEPDVERLVAHDVLELLADADHLALAFQCQHHREAGVEEDPFHDDVETDKVPHEGTDVGGGLQPEGVVVQSLREVDDELVFLRDGGDPIVQAIEGLGLEPQRVTAVDERVRVDRVSREI